MQAFGFSDLSDSPAPTPRHQPTISSEATITLAHGSGGSAMRDLIADVFVGSFDNPALSALEDQARFDLAALAQRGDRLAFTTDSYVVDPLFFPGGDIGTLAVNGTVNDLAVSGAVPLYLTCAVILEEGLPLATLRRVVQSLQAAAQQAGVQIVTGDTKVVPRGSADQLFLNTAGIGMIPAGINPEARQIQPGDVVLVNGPIGNHGAAILAAREDLALTTALESDCQPLHGLVQVIAQCCPQVRALRDATRGGLATVLNEFASSAGVSIYLQESALPVEPAVSGLCELLGLDPLYLANEGKLVVVVPPQASDRVLAAMQSHPAGEGSRIIGTVADAPARTVVMQTALGSHRVVDMLVGDQLPRIC